MKPRNDQVLEAMIRRQQVRVDAAQRALAEAGQRRDAVQTGLDRLIEAQERLPRVASFDQRDGFDLHAYRRTVQWLDDLETRIARQRAALTEAEAAIDTARQNCLDEAERLRAIEEGRAREQAAVDTAVERRVQRDADARWLQRRPLPPRDLV